MTGICCIVKPVRKCIITGQNGIVVALMAKKGQRTWAQQLSSHETFSLGYIEVPVA
jgi:hypothetical protein